MRDRIGRQPRAFEKVRQGDPLVVSALVDVVDVELAQAAFEEPGAAPRDDCGRDALAGEHLQRLAILGAENLRLCAVLCVLEATVGEDAVDVQTEQAHALRAFWRRSDEDRGS